jgi:hypothetical protein
LELEYSNQEMLNQVNLILVTPLSSINKISLATQS